jgi:hypothetical protein
MDQFAAGSCTRVAAFDVNGPDEFLPGRREATNAKSTPRSINASVAGSGTGTDEALLCNV